MFSGDSLALKEGAEVMLLYNISSKLTNGTRGRIVSLCEDAPIVNFYKVGIHYKVSKVTWFAYKPGSVDTIVGQRTQYPLKLAWGITVHKSQGQTLKACCVHSGKEFVPGQLYVACSRVSSVKGLSIVNFNERKLIFASRKMPTIMIKSHLPTIYVGTIIERRFQNAEEVYDPKFVIDECAENDNGVTLKEKWIHLFSNSDEDGKQSATEILFHKVIDK
ncbi:hypothetical protein QZH41_018149 [Actinostola sp. cb2023]|nr:hypothetical protein QZH41_018149 [Actinostola sp. cb2023]